MGIAMGSEGESAGVNAQDPAARKVVEYFLKKRKVVEKSGCTVGWNYGSTGRWTLAEHPKFPVAEVHLLFSKEREEVHPFCAVKGGTSDSTVISQLRLELQLNITELP